MRFPASLPPSDRPARALVLLLLAAATLAAFGAVLHHDWLRLDDPGYVLENPQISGGLRPAGLRWALTHPHGGNWHPLTSASHMLDVTLFGLSPAGPHAVNLLLHILNALLLALVLHRLSGAWWRSVLVAALFALHPLRVESVAWISERKDVLSGLLFVLTLGAYGDWARRPTAGRWALVIAGLTLGLLAKPMLVTVPFVLVLVDVWPLGRWGRRSGGTSGGAPARSLVGLVLEKWPLLLLAGASSAMTLHFQRMAGAVDTTLPPAQRLANATLSVWRYVGTSLWPARLSPHYAPAPIAPVAVILAALAALATTILALGRLRRASPVAIGWLWYLGMLVPVLGLVQVGMQSCADRYTYLPGIGLAIAVAWPLGDWVGTSRTRRAFAVAGAIAVLFALGLATVRQVAVWHDTRTLYRHALRVGGENVMTLNGLAAACEADSEQVEAVRYLRRAIELAPDYANSYVGLGVALARLRDWSGSAAALHRAIELAPWRADAFLHLGIADQALGRGAESESDLRRALALQPEYPAALDRLGMAAVAAGRVGEGLDLFARAAAAAGHAKRASLPIALALLTQPGQDSRAAAYLRQAVTERPDDPDALNALAWLLATSPDPAVRDGAGAVSAAARAVAVTHASDPNVLDTQAAALATAGRFAEAAAIAQRAGGIAARAHADSLAAPIRARLALYRAGRAFVDSSRIVRAR